MQDGYQLRRYRGCYAASLYVGGERKGRFTLGTDCKEDAERQVRDLNAQRERDQLPAALTVDAVFGLYIADREREGKVAVPRMRECRALLKPHFGALYPGQIDKELCETYIKRRRNLGISNGTIRTELTYLSTCLRFGVDMKHIQGPAPRIWRPSPGRPRSQGGDYHLTRDEVVRLLDASSDTPHLALFIRLMLATAGRPKHVLELTWTRVSFRRGTINLDNDSEATNKGRALVTMSDEIRAALEEARKIAETPYVIEFNGNDKPLKRIKGALERAAERAGVKASPYVMRHTAAVWMAEEGIPLEEIAQYLGHTSIEITRKHYARYSPAYLKRAANATQVVRGSTGSREPKNRNAA
jgi:integrase